MLLESKTMAPSSKTGDMSSTKVSSQKGTNTSDEAQRVAQTTGYSKPRPQSDSLTQSSENLMYGSNVPVISTTQSSKLNANTLTVFKGSATVLSPPMIILVSILFLFL